MTNYIEYSINFTVRMSFQKFHFGYAQINPNEDDIKEVGSYVVVALTTRRKNKFSHWQNEIFKYDCACNCINVYNMQYIHAYHSRLFILK